MLTSMRRRTAEGARTTSPLVRRLRRASLAFDARADLWFEGHRGHRRGQQALYAASLLAEAVLLVAGGLTAVIGSPRTEVTRHRIEFLALAGLFTAVGKGFVGRQRPFQPHERPIHVSPDTSSFPSGHTLWAVVSAAWLAHDRWSPWLTYPAAAFVAVSRVHLRLHRASDVTAAAIIGGTACVIARRRHRRPATS